MSIAAFPMPKEGAPNGAATSLWTFKLMTDANGRAMPNLANVMTALREASEIADAFTYDEMLMACILERPLPCPEDELAASLP